MKYFYYSHGARSIINIFVPLEISEFNIKQDIYIIRGHRWKHISCLYNLNK